MELLGINLSYYLVKNNPVGLDELPVNYNAYIINDYQDVNVSFFGLLLSYL